jgi:hypothetical protein
VHYVLTVKRIYLALKRRKISNGNEITVIFDNIVEGLRFARCWAFFEAYNGVHYVLRQNAVIWACIRRNILMRTKITVIFDNIVEGLRFAFCWACFEA